MGRQVQRAQVAGCALAGGGNLCEGGMVADWHCLETPPLARARADAAVVMAVAARPRVYFDVAIAGKAAGR